MHPRSAPRPGAAVALQPHRVGAARPLVWLHRGWEDMHRAWRPSLGHGVLIAASGFLALMVAASLPALLPTLIGAFMLLAPFVAAVHYGLSRQIEAGRPPTAPPPGPRRCATRVRSACSGCCWRWP